MGKYYTIIGRIPGDDEDSCVTLRADSVVAAMNQFEEWMWEDKTDEEKAEWEGEKVYINYVLSSNEEPVLERCFV
jgi:hypothetical protein